MQKQQKKRSIIAEMIAGGLSASAATVIVNPADVIKVRLQLQGELQSADKVQKTYKGFTDCLVKIVQQEGFLAIQKGFIPACSFAFTMNAVRLGFFEPMKSNLNKISLLENKHFTQALIASSFCGALGSWISTPLFLMKVRLQTQASQAVKNAVGVQYDYKGIIDGFQKVVAKEGFKGLYRGSQQLVLNITLASIWQLTSYDYFKRTLIGYGYQEGFQMHIVVSLLAGLSLSIGNNPMDVVASRVFNQKAGQEKLYTGTVDAFTKIFQTEGIAGMFKGCVPRIIRFTPTTILHLTIWEKLRAVADQYDL